MSPFRGRSRPLCAYPKIARYQGGDPEKETSFACTRT
jgi:feruloyl esterase